MLPYFAVLAWFERLTLPVLQKDRGDSGVANNFRGDVMKSGFCLLRLEGLPFCLPLPPVITHHTSPIRQKLILRMSRTTCICISGKKKIHTSVEDKTMRVHYTYSFARS